MTAEMLKRNYRIADAEMLAAAKTCRLFFEEDKADFVGFAAPFADPFSADWLLLIEQAEAEQSDESIVDVQTGLTNDVEHWMDMCRKHYQRLKYFIGQAYPENLSIQNEFGYDDYEEARNNQLRMMAFMQQLHHAADKYKVNLFAEGYTQQQLDDILNLKTRLDQANQDQEQYKGNRGVLTQDRVEKHNAVWEIFQQVCAAGKRVYIDDYAKHQRYLLPASEEAQQALSLSGTVLQQGTALPLAGVSISIVELGISTTTDGLGVFGFGNGLPAGNYTLRASLQGYGNIESPINISDGHDIINLEMTEV